MSYILNACLFRIVLPILMLICVVFRPSVLSAVYLLFTLCSAFCKVPSHRSMAGGTGIYLKILIVVSILGMLSQGAFQIYLIATGPYASVLDQMDEKWVEVLRYCGYVRMDHANPITIITWISPEILLPLTAVVIFTLIRRLTSTETDPSEAGEVTAQAMKVKRSRHRFFLASGTYILVLTLCVCAVLRPSVQGGVYFLAFICAATWLSCSKRLERGFAYITRLLMVLVFVHIAALYTYQIEYIKDLVGDNSTYTRYFALTEFYTLDADDPRIFVANTLEWDSFLNPWCLVFLFFMSTMMSRHLLKPKLMRGVSPSRKYGTESKKGPAILQDSTGSVIVAEHEDIQLNRLEEEKTSCLETMLYVFDQLLQFVVQISYIATNIIMMTWSITYHSWLTFVLLLWANLLWIIPNQRRSMLRSSPFLVFYAIFLLISAYIYSMDLTEDELPSQVQGINLAQIGFEKITELPCRPLLAKCAYTMFFWFTLRQYTKELKEAKQSSTLADMVAPLQVTVGTAAGVPQDNAEHEASKVLGKIGEVLKKFLTRSWIWVVAITLFVVAITGERMTVFRILYMALFLFFILTFQLSFRIWRKMMFGFWLTVIIYSMTMLILVYTYQFDNFPKYWTDYLHIPPEQQLDIGLQTYATSQLFVRLATPTSFVIVTVIQLHYFHKDFLSLSHPPVLQDLRHARSDSADASSLQGEVTDVSSSATVKTAASPTTKIDLTDIGHISTRQLKHSFLYYWRKLCRFMDLVYLFLEIHMHRFVLFVAVLMCIYDKCAIYSAVVLALLIGITVGRKVSIGVIYTISVFTAILLLLRMVYQVQYIPADRWNVTCQLKESNYTANDAEWMGFYKSTHLPSIVKWNIAYLSVVTLFSVIVIRQHNARIVAGTPITRIFFMFPSIRRFDADKNIRNVLKYFLNYGYYKFGFEISLIATVAVIGIRMDFYAACYAVWLCLLCSMNRETIKRGWWNVYLIFICMTISIEYFMSLGLLPSLCIEYPWYLTPTLARMQDWVFLMDNFHPPNARKLICEFLLLFFVARQRVVFRIEKRYADREYAGGSNASVTHFAEQKDFVNPVPDFITYTRTYLDVLKRLVLIGFMWITLGSLFLAGTNRVNIFSVGYLIGAFIFLWQGTDIYLRPIAIIIKHWNWLIYYNVFVILLKTSFQLVGCVFAPPANNETCWLIQLLGIGCVNKFTPNPRATLDETCHVPRESIGLAWDGVCFAFLIMQKRIFSSYNFFHIVDDTKATTILASRGCELIEQIRQKRMQEKEELEKQVLEKIKAKMDRIKATQQRIQGPHYEPVNNHYVDGIFPKSRPLFRTRQPKTYKQAIRSGDYYMFDELGDEDDLDVVEELRSQDDLDTKSTRDKPGVGEIEESPRRTTTPDDEKPPEPKPGTSKDEDDITEPPVLQKQSQWQMVVDWLLFTWKFIESLMVSLISYLNRYSKDFRYVVKMLTRERKILKESSTYTEGLRLGRGQIWRPNSSYNTLIHHARSSQSTISNIDQDDDTTELSQYDQPTILRLAIAVWYILMSHSDILCYFIIFLNQIKSANFMTLPLPLAVFLWGTLTIPRPSKTFWVSLIAYTQGIVLVKCLFQFEFWPWNQYSTSSTYPYYPPRILGVEKNLTYAIWDLMLLFVLFFHRYLLKTLGLWKATIVTVPLLSDGEYAIQDISKKPERSTEKSEDIQDDEEDDEESKKLKVTIEATDMETYELFPNTINMATVKYGEPIKEFFRQLRDPTSRASTDVYSYMFLCDFFNFFVILIGYSSFGAQQGDGGVSSYLQDNRVPYLFLLMLILQFLLIIVDRAIFLRKNITAKIVFQFIQIGTLHIWLFVLFPVITERDFNSVIPPQMYYMVKCFYLLLSAYQIRCGYPMRILGNFLCKGYNYVNMFLFKGFMIVPFLFELRTVMDWMWTDTSMTVFDWIKMEDIFAQIFQLKCTRHVESEFPQPRGVKKASLTKYMMGGLLLFIIIAIIWFPLVFFSLGNAVGEPNIPYDVTLDIRIGPYEPVYHLSAQANSIFSFDANDFALFESAYHKDKVATTFLSNYQYTDVAAIKLSRESANIWSISPPDRTRMIEEVNSTNDISILLQYTISHKTSGNKEDPGIIRTTETLTMTPEVNGEPNPERTKLLRMLSGNDTDAFADAVSLDYILPKFLKVTNRGTAESVKKLMIGGEFVHANSLRSLNLTLTHSPDYPLQEWWTIQENCSDANYKVYLRKLPYVDCNAIMLYTFNDRIFPATLSLITAGGIIGVYTTLVFVASRFLRGFFSEICFKIMFDDMPNVDRVLQLCFDIYLVREAREFCLEEDLFAKLVFLFRSPETLIKWTRPKEETEDDDDPEGEAD